MTKELLEQYQALRNNDAVTSISIETVAGCTSIVNRAMVNKVMDFIINEARKELICQEQ